MHGGGIDRPKLASRRCDGVHGPAPVPARAGQRSSRTSEQGATLAAPSIPPTAGFSGVRPLTEVVAGALTSARASIKLS